MWFRAGGEEVGVEAVHRYAVRGTLPRLRIARHEQCPAGPAQVQGRAGARHPRFARLAFSRPPLGPHALALYDAALAALDAFELGAA